MSQVDFQAGKPVYLELADQIRHAAASGRLRPGEPLPSLRPLAEEWRINRNTIARASEAIADNAPEGFLAPARAAIAAANGCSLRRYWNVTDKNRKVCTSPSNPAAMRTSSGFKLGRAANSTCCTITARVGLATAGLVKSRKAGNTL